jgi:hypothetical protein
MEEKVTGACRRLHNEELHNFHALPSVITVIKSRKMRWTGHVVRMEAMINVYSILVAKSEGKRPLGRHRRRWGDNIRMDQR